MPLPPSFTELRAEMVQQQLKERGILNQAILSAMNEVPREAFVPHKLRGMAYRNSPLPIPDGQTISQPYVVAYMIDLLNIAPTDSVLEVGTGSGYAAAIISQLAAKVYTVERHENLVQYAHRRFTALKYKNIYLRQGDGTLGWTEHAPYDAILVSAGGPFIPVPLKEQLAIGGRLVMPMGKWNDGQLLIRLTRLGQEKFDYETFEDVSFVPLIGKEGWQDRKED